MTLTKSHALHAAPDLAGSLKHSDIREALLQKRSSCSQAGQASADHHHTRLSPSPKATTERVIRTVATGFTTLHTVRTDLLGACDKRGVWSSAHLSQQFLQAAPYLAPSPRPDQGKTMPKSAKRHRKGQREMRARQGDMFQGLLTGRGGTHQSHPQTS